MKPAKRTAQVLLTYIIFLFLITTPSCGSNQKGLKNGEAVEQTIQNMSKLAQFYAEFADTKFKQSFESSLNQELELSSLYKNINDEMIWFDHGQIKSEEIKLLISILKELPAHGINQPEYTREIENLFDSINLYESEEVEESLERAFTLEKYCTYAAYNLIKGMNYGFTNPRKLFGKIYDVELLEEDSLFQQQTLLTLKANPNKTLSTSLSPNDTYLLIKDQLSIPYISVDSIYPMIKFKKNESYILDDKNEVIKLIAERLNYLGYYNDSLSNTVTEKLITAINQLRLKHSYPETDQLTIETVNILNTSTQYYLERIKANLERNRWRRKKEDRGKHIVVNIATQDLFAMDNKEIKYQMRVVVGSKKNKTPILESKMSFINLNPYWHVPISIATKEILLKQQKDSTYIDRLGFEIFHKGTKVNQADIDWKNMTQQEFKSYFLRQKPSNINALGRIKFMFKNNHSVYLHDTPSKNGFKQLNRTTSHGCVRISEPIELAKFFITTDESFEKKLKHTISATDKQTKDPLLLRDTLYIKEPIDLLIDYKTMYSFPNNNEIYYAKDPYEYDPIIIKALDTISFYHFKPKRIKVTLD